MNPVYRLITCLLSVFILAPLIVSPESAYTRKKKPEYELVPFKLKKLPPVREKKDPLETMRVINERTDIERPRVHDEIGFKVGFTRALTGIKGNSKLSIPFISLFYRPEGLNFSKSFFGELELAYFYLESSNSFASQVDVKVHTIMPFVSLGYKIRIADWYKLVAKLGIGASFQFVSRDITGVSPFLQQFDRNTVNIHGVAKIALQNEWSLSKHTKLIIGADAFVPFDPNGFILFLSPNAGLSYAFDYKPVRKRRLGSQLSIRGGVMFPLTRIGGDVKTISPYVSVAYTPSFLQMSKYLALEMELVYFYMKSKDNLLQQKEVHSFLPMMNIVISIPIAKWYTLSPKIGGGVIFQLAKEQFNAAGIAPTLHQFGSNKKTVIQGVAHFGLQNELHLTKTFKIFVNGDLFWQLAPNGMITYLSPNLGAAFRF
ncbi:MAG: hypothetical protein IEMM0008_0742 [bacterium]|nr:MAG: hypothetical protein IEMM0008_0742 [bacterium]